MKSKEKYVPASELPKPPEGIEKRCGGAFGMSEMEDAAGVIASKAVKAGTWDVRVGLRDFPVDAEAYEENVGGLRFVEHHKYAGQNGFLHLLKGGWMMASFDSKSLFIPSKAFVDRIVGNKKWVNS